MKKTHLAVAVIGALVISSSTIASAEGGSHRRLGGYLTHMTSVPPIALSSGAGVLTIDTTGTVPSFAFDTTTVTPHIDFDPSKAAIQFDSNSATSEDGEDDDDYLPAGASLPVIPALPPVAPSNPTAPTVPATPPLLSAGLPKHFDNSGEDNADDSDNFTANSEG